MTQLADHLIGSVTYLCAAAGGDARCRSRYQSAGGAGRHGGPGHARGLGASAGSTARSRSAPHEMPAGAALGISVHRVPGPAWDFARATGQQVAVSRRWSPSIVLGHWPARSSHRKPGTAEASRRPDRGPVLTPGCARLAYRLHRPKPIPSRGISWRQERTSIHAGHAELGGPADQLDPGRGQGVLRRAVRLDLRSTSPWRGAGYSMMLMLRRPPGRRLSPRRPGWLPRAPRRWRNTYLRRRTRRTRPPPGVEAAGGRVAMAPFDVMDAGRMSFVMDPSGAPVALWQANQHIGATLVNEPGTHQLERARHQRLRRDQVLRRRDRPDHREHGHGRGASRTRCSSPATRWWAARRRRRCPACPATGTCASAPTTRTPPRPRRPSSAGRSSSRRSTPRSGAHRRTQRPARRDVQRDQERAPA